MLSIVATINSTQPKRRSHDAVNMLALANDVADAVVEALANVSDWGKSGLRPDQYVPDVVANEAALNAIRTANFVGLKVLSEESGLEGEGELVVVIDPIDGSTNASQGLGWYSTSICIVDESGPWIALVHDHPNNVRYCAVRGQGVTKNGKTLTTPPIVEISDAIVAINGLPSKSPNPSTHSQSEMASNAPARVSPPKSTNPSTHLHPESSATQERPRWWQFRSFGSCALEMCAVADGRLAGYIDFSNSLRVWDYLGALLVCTELGLEVRDAAGRNLVALDPPANRAPIAANPNLIPHLLAST